MKKLFISMMLIAASVFLNAAYAQRPAFTQYSIAPTVYTAEDEITITVDVAGTDLAGASSVYIWTWANEVNGGGAVNSKVNTAWGDSPEAAKLTAVAGSPNKFTFKLIGTDIFQLTPGALVHFQFLLKSKDGSKQTGNTTTNKFDPLVFVPSMLRVFPAKVGQNDIVSVYFHQDMATTVNEQRMTPATVTVKVYDNTGALAGNALTLPVKSAGAKLWRAYFVPTKSYTPGAGKKFVRFTYQFNGTVRDENNAAVTVSTAETEVTLTDMK